MDQQNGVLEGPNIDNRSVKDPASADGDAGLIHLTTQKEWQAGHTEILAVTCLAIISLVVALDATILVPVLPNLAEKLHGTSIESFWIGTAFLLPNATFQPFIGALSDVFGRRELMLSSVSLFVVGSIIAALADEFPQLLAGRTIQGIGGGGIIALVLIICTDIIPLRQRPRFNGYIQISWAVGTVSGPLIGGAFGQDVTWRWIFWINVPICVIGGGMAFFVIRFQTRHRSFATKVSDIDWIGGILLISSSSTFLLGITWGGVQYPWGSYQTLLPLLLGLVGGAAFLAWESKCASHPFIRMQLFRSTSSLAAYACALLQGFVMYAGLYYLSLYLLFVADSSPIMTGVYMIPITAGLIPTSIAVGAAISKRGTFRWALWSGWSVITLANGLLISLGLHTKVYPKILIFLVLGIGHGLLMNSLNFAVQAIAAVEDAAYATALYAFMRGVGMCLGVGIGGTIFQNDLSRQLAMRELPTAIASDAEGYVSVLHQLPTDSSKRIGILEAYICAFRTLFIMLTAVCGASGLLSTIIKHHSLDKALASKHVLKKRGRREIATLG